MVTRWQNQQIIARWIEPHPRKRGAEEARLKGSKVSVWAIIGQLRAEGRDVGRVAEDYNVPLGAVEAALAYYEQHQAAIDDRLAANELRPC